LKSDLDFENGMRPPKKPHTVQHVLRTCFDVYGRLVISGVPARGIIRLPLTTDDHQKSRELQPRGEISTIFWKGPNTPSRKEVLARLNRKPMFEFVFNVCADPPAPVQSDLCDNTVVLTQNVIRVRRSVSLRFLFLWLEPETVYCPV